jgi:hypothetical protein
MTIVEKVRADIKAAMLARNEATLSALRMVQAEFLKKEKEKVGSVLGDDQASAILSAIAKQRRDSIEQYKSAGRPDLMAKEQVELDLILNYLPEGLSDEEIEREVNAAIVATGATSGKDAGKVLGPLMKALKATGKPFDGQVVQARVKARLGA